MNISLIIAKAYYESGDKYISFLIKFKFPRSNIEQNKRITKYYLSLYKGGGSAQGIAMHQLVKASKKQLALTGTIAGGYASDLFYLLYRLDSGRMKKSGYEYSPQGELKFVRDYGTLETKYETGGSSQSEFNSASKGRMISSPKCRPGISPLVYVKFLLDCAVFLDISDMSDQLPVLKESVITVPLEDEIKWEYNRVRTLLKTALKTREGKTILGSYQQFSLSYTDKPYGREPILSPIDGSVLATPKDINIKGLLNKEKTLIDYVRKEVEEKRNVVIYCEFTGKAESNITYRLRESLIKELKMSENEACILESSYPSPEKREEWMHKQAELGAKVIITNPRCCETGLDFCFEYNKKIYNYPTIINYQLGSSLYTVMQANYRHYRLNQTTECRTIYIVSEGTIQIDFVDLIANKQVATQVLQGKFSSEGLAAMASGIDSRILIAQNYSEMEEKDRIQRLKEKFDSLNDKGEKNKEKRKEKLMLTFYELTGKSKIQNVITMDYEQSDFLDYLFPEIFSAQKEEIPESVAQDVQVEKTENWVSIKKKRTRESKKQMDLFHFYNKEVNYDI